MLTEKSNKQIKIANNNNTKKTSVPWSYYNYPACGLTQFVRLWQHIFTFFTRKIPIQPKPNKPNCHDMSDIYQPFGPVTVGLGLLGWMSISL